MVDQNMATYANNTPLVTYLFIILLMNAAGYPGDGDAVAQIFLGSAQIDALDGEIGAAFGRPRSRPEVGDARIRAHGPRVKSARRSALIAQRTTQRRTILTVAPRTHQVSASDGMKGEGGGVRKAVDLILTFAPRAYQVSVSVNEQGR